jgi:internalin A
MTKANNRLSNVDDDDDMLPEYNFSKLGQPVRGKYAEAMRQGYSVTVHHPDGTSTTRHVPPQNNGDTILGDKIGGDKILGNKISITNHNEHANIANLVNNPQDNVTIKAEQFSQTSGTNPAELLQIIANLRQITTQFPQQNQDDIIIDLDDIEQEFQKPQQQRNIPKIRKRLLAVAAAVLSIASPIAAIADFTNNITDLANKAGIELQLPSIPKNQVF